MQIFLYLRHKQSQYFLRSDFTSDYNELATPFKMRLKEGKILEKRVATQCLESFIRNISQKLTFFRRSPVVKINMQYSLIFSKQAFCYFSDNFLIVLYMFT